MDIYNTDYNASSDRYFVNLQFELNAPASKQKRFNELNIHTQLIPSNIILAAYTQNTFKLNTKINVNVEFNNKKFSIEFNYEIRLFN